MRVIAPTLLVLSVLWELDKPNKFLLLSMSTHVQDTCMSFPCAEECQTASLLAQLFERVRIQVIRLEHAGAMRLHTDKAGEIESRDLESFYTWSGIVNMFTHTAAHLSDGVVEWRIGLLNKEARSCFLRNGLPHYL